LGLCFIDKGLRVCPVTKIGEVMLRPAGMASKLNMFVFRLCSGARELAANSEFKRDLIYI
jgi:hypothetical protein